MKIFGWAADNAGPGFYRLRVPFAELAKNGHEATVNPFMPSWVLDEADVIVGQRVSQPGAAATWRRMAMGQFSRRPLMVFEIDDDLWDVDPANAPAWRFYGQDPEILRNLTESARVADVCTVSTEPLADIVRKINPNVVVLPNQLPAVAFSDPTRAPEGRWSHSGLQLGWGGGMSHVDDVGEMVDALRQWLRRHPQDAYLNSGTLFPEVANATRPRLIQRDWTMDMNEHYTRLLDLDIGLAPLRATLFNRSKSEIKFLEYAAAGAACVASKHGPYERTIVHGQTGFLASQAHQWTHALRELADPSTRLAMASRAFEYAQTRMIEKHWQSWEQVYQGKF